MVFMVSLHFQQNVEDNLNHAMDIILKEQGKKYREVSEGREGEKEEGGRKGERESKAKQ